MANRYHEIRDPIHVFVRLDSSEREVVNSFPFQRLRYIHQLAMTYLVYPGATHRRFEHSLGVMELAGRVYDIVTEPCNIKHESVREIVPQKDDRKYLNWRMVLRMAALCHDMGHLPFSHAAEKELLPEDWDHERLTLEIILSQEMQKIFKDIDVDPENVAKLAVGAKKYRKYKDSQYNFTDLEAILSEIIVGDAFGVDRIDYLLRDSHHAGVAYGKFDHYRLIDTLRILPKEYEESEEPALGIEEGGLHSAEALMLARFFMYKQLYFHPVRRIYDIHLKDFLKAWLPNGYFSTDLLEHLCMTDNEVLAAMLKAAKSTGNSAHELAKRIVERQHFKLLYQRNPVDTKINIGAAQAIFDAATHKYGAENIRFDNYNKKDVAPVFPVHTKDGRIASSIECSDILKDEHIPAIAIEYIFISPEFIDTARKWLNEYRHDIITTVLNEEAEEE